MPGRGDDREAVPSEVKTLLMTSKVCCCLSGIFSEIREKGVKRRMYLTINVLKGMFLRLCMRIRLNNFSYLLEASKMFHRF